MEGLKGSRIALLEARMATELAALIKSYGGEPICVPAVKESPLDCQDQVAAFLDQLASGSIDIIVFQTGVGARALFKDADRLGRLPEALEELRKRTTVARGPKPTAALRQYDVPVSVAVDEPFTTTEVIRALSGLDLADRGVGVVHYGERNQELVDALAARAARLFELCLYEWLMPDDTNPLKQLIDNIVAGGIGSVAFTSKVQVRHLFQVAASISRSEELAGALNAKTIVVAIGPTCAAALETYGVTPKVVPEHPKMGHMVRALADYLARSQP